MLYRSHQIRFAAALVALQVVAQGVLAQAADRSVAVLPTVALTARAVEADDIWQQVTRLLSREPGIRVAEMAAAAAFADANGSVMEAANALGVRFVLVTEVSGVYRADVQLRDGRAGAIVWGKTIWSDEDNIANLPGEIWVVVLAALRQAEL